MRVFASTYSATSDSALRISISVTAHTSQTSGNSHSAEGSMDGGAADLDGDDGVERADGGLEGREEVVLVREDAEVAGLDAQADTGGDVLLGRLEPRVALRLLEDVVEDGVVGVVVHCVLREKTGVR